MLRLWQKYFGWRVLLALSLVLASVHPARAWDLWLVTSDHRLIILRDVDRLPYQVARWTHPPVPDAYDEAFGGWAFAPNGNLYAVSLTLGSPAVLYRLDATNGSYTPIGPFPFEWGNTLYFHPRTGRGYVGGGLESWRPYELLHGFYIFDSYDPATTRLWHDMRPDFPSGGYTVGYAHHDGYLYALWGTGHMYAHTIYLLRITEDTAGNFVSYSNLGDVESHGIPEGGWDLISDGATLYVISPQALYRVDLGTTPPTFTRVWTFDLAPDEVVNSGTAPWADLELTWQMADTILPQDEPTSLILEITNRGPHTAERVEVQVSLPTGLQSERLRLGQGTYDAARGLWQVGTLAPGQQVQAVWQGRARTPGVWAAQAQIVHTSTLDPDSATTAGFAQDDWGDGQTDDDEAAATLTIVPGLPQTGFPPMRVTSRPATAPRGGPTAALALTLEIPRLQQRAAIVGVPLGPRGWDVAWLGPHSVGWLQGTAFPTWRGNTVLTGHVWNADGTPGVFYGLERLRYGDRILLAAGEATVTYQVVDNRLVPETAVDEVLQHSEEDRLTLLTCARYDESQGRYLLRRVVQAVRVAAP